jgi:DNA-binding transcriptional LysR family regulator
MIAGISAAEQEVRDEGHSPAGTLRLSVPAAFGLRYLTTPMAEFARLHPQLRMIVHYDDRKVDVVGEGYDLSIRGGTVTEDDMVARKLWSFQTLLVAAPSYLAQLPAPQAPSELEAHPAVLYEGSATPGIWTFQRGKERESVVMRSVFMANAASAVHAACLAGIGVAVQPEWMVNEDIAAGRLLHLLPDWELPTYAFWMLRPNRKGVPARAPGLPARQAPPCALVPAYTPSQVRIGAK